MCYCDQWYYIRDDPLPSIDATARVNIPEDDQIAAEPGNNST